MVLGLLIFIFRLIVGYVVATVLIVSCLVTSLSLFLIGKSLCLQSCFFNSFNVFTLFFQVFFKRSFKLRKSMFCSCLQDLQSVSGLWCFCSYSILRHQSWLFKTLFQVNQVFNKKANYQWWLHFTCCYLVSIFISLIVDHMISA